MSENYAEVLESYIIPEPAEEGVLTGILSAIGALVMLPYVLVAGVMVVYGIHVAAEARKLKKLIKKNKGKYSGYGSASKIILREYSKDINGVEEPQYFSKIVTYYQKAASYIGSAKAIRDEFSRTAKTDPNNSNEYNKILVKIETLYKQVNALYKAASPDDWDDYCRQSEKIKVSLNQSNLLKMTDYGSTILDFLAEGDFDSTEYGYIVANCYDMDGDIWNEFNSNTDAKVCIEKFDEVCEILEIFSETYNLMEFCRFAVNPKAKRNKK